MDLSGLEKKLMAAARSTPTGEQVPYAFEKRIMARLTALPQADEWTWWSRALWRGAGACAAITLLFSAWSLSSFHTSAKPNSADDLEEVVLASVNDVTW